MTQIRHADISFKENGTPVSNAFDDVYFSKDNGLAETDYVFLQQNGLPEHWHNHRENHFVIAETGFGTGLNFLTAGVRFTQFRDKNPDSKVKHLHFISVEKFPLQQNALRQALAQWPELAPLSEQLITQYPQAVAGCHRLVFNDGSITLDLWFGDVKDCFPQIVSDNSGLVDAWFLDGFAPSKNPQMWQDSLFQQMARLGKPGSSFATFTAAGFVRRGLIQAGYQAKKVKGFGHKRDMLSGTLEKTQFPARHCYQRHTPQKLGTVAIVGGGMAAANLAYSLAQHAPGTELHIIDKDATLAQGASGNAQGGFYPLLHSEYSISSEFHALSYLFAAKRYQALAQSHDYAHNFCGLLQPFFTPDIATRYQKILNSGHWPDTLVHYVNQQQTGEISGLPLEQDAMYFPQGGWINPPSLCKALIDSASAQLELHYHPSTHVCGISREGERFTLDTGAELPEFDTLILCTGTETNLIQGFDEVAIEPVRGQVTQVTSDSTLSELKTVICAKGYLTPAWQGTHCVGSSFVKQDTDTQVRESENQHNLSLLEYSFGAQAWHQNLEVVAARASLRATTRDHLPLVGQMPIKKQHQSLFEQLSKGSKLETQTELAQPGLFILSGLGSRGLCTAPLAAELLTSQLTGKPLPVSQRVSQALNPNRFWLRKMIKGQTLE